VIYAIVDIETTGGNPKESKITEIAIYKHDGRDITDQFETLVNPEMAIQPFVSNLTGINNQLVKDAPKFFEIAKKIIAFTEDCVFVAHNVSFDYKILRAEFKSLGFDYRRPHLCTVSTSKKLLPGHESYSLGKLTRSLGIELEGRHRAGGDALATAKLFTLLHQTDQNDLITFIQEELKPKILHPNLDLDAIEEIPNKIGIYKFYNEFNKLIYIGRSKHIRTRIEHHLKTNKTKKSAQMQPEILRIEYELTGSELIAALRESILAQKNKPVYNSALSKSKSPYGLFHYTDEIGYYRLFIAQISKLSESPLLSFSSKKDGENYLENVVDEQRLCKKLCGLQTRSSSCFEYSLKKCRGACIGEELPKEYNKRIDTIINELNFNNETFYIIDRGRNRGEKSLVLVEKGIIKGMGYAPYHFNRKPASKWKSFIELRVEDSDTKSLVKLFLNKNETHEIVHF